jgi:hypothetical protein
MAKFTQRSIIFNLICLRITCFLYLGVESACCQPLIVFPLQNINIKLYGTNIKKKKKKGGRDRMAEKIISFVV